MNGINATLGLISLRTGVLQVGLGTGKQPDGPVGCEAVFPQQAIERSDTADLPGADAPNLITPG